MKIQYCSDLHLEFLENKNFLKRNPLQPVGDILVLAGDVVPFAVMDKHKDFFSYVSDHFETTYWLPGNHEYYRFDAAERSGAVYEKIRKNVFLVNNISVIHRDARLIFSTLWSTISPGYQWQIEKNMSDFHLIKYKGFRLSADVYNQLHIESLACIQREIAGSTQAQNLVFTHHCPTFMHYPAQYKGDVLNEAFAVELTDFIIDSKIDYWIYGHHHTNTPEFCIGNTKLITNQLGYVQYHEHTLFENGKCLLL